MQYQIIEYSHIYDELKNNNYFGKLPDDTIKHIVYFVMSDAAIYIVRYIHNKLNKSCVINALKQVSALCYDDACGGYNSFSLCACNTYRASIILSRNFAFIKNEDWFKQYIVDFGQNANDDFYRVIEDLQYEEDATVALQIFMQADSLSKIISLYEEIQLQIFHEELVIESLQMYQM